MRGLISVIASSAALSAVSVAHAEDYHAPSSTGLRIGIASTVGATAGLGTLWVLSDREEPDWPVAIGAASAVTIGAGAIGYAVASTNGKSYGLLAGSLTGLLASPIVLFAVQSATYDYDRHCCGKGLTAMGITMLSGAAVGMAIAPFIYQKRATAGANISLTITPLSIAGTF